VSIGKSIMPDISTVEVEEKYFKRILKDHLLLEMLISGGVERWTYWDSALDTFNRLKESYVSTAMKDNVVEKRVYKRK